MPIYLAQGRCGGPSLLGLATSPLLEQWVAVAGIHCQDSQQVHPCKLGRDIPVAHGPGSEYPPQLTASSLHHFCGDDSLFQLEMRQPGECHALFRTLRNRDVSDEPTGMYSRRVLKKAWHSPGDSKPRDPHSAIQPFTMVKNKFINPFLLPAAYSYIRNQFF